MKLSHLKNSRLINPQAPTKASGIKKNLKRIALTAALVAPLYLVSGISNYSDVQCTSSSLANVQTANVCISQHSANNSWLAWISGNSRSTQFQFIDLFELIHGDKEEPRKAVIPTREG